jgi:hypothetical protein
MKKREAFMINMELKEINSNNGVEEGSMEEGSMTGFQILSHFSRIIISKEEMVTILNKLINYYL